MVDEAAIREVLESGHLAGAAFDVHQGEGEGQVSSLADLSNVILTPHIGASTVESLRELGEILFQCLDQYDDAPLLLPAVPENFIVIWRPGCDDDENLFAEASPDFRV